jgi:hypothetical protein
VTFFAGAGPSVAIMDFGAHVDGPGVGLLVGYEGASGALLSLGFLAGIFTVVFAWRWPTARFVGLTAGVAAFVLFDTFGMRELFWTSWKLQCAAGALDACWASEQARAAGPSPESREAVRAGCRSNDRRACVALLEDPSPEDRALLCAGLVPACAGDCAKGGCNATLVCFSVKDQCHPR